MKPRYYVGLASSYHDSALAIVDPDGTCVFAEASERYLQDKRALHSVPDHLIRAPELVRAYCGPDAELVVALTWSKRMLTAMRQAAGSFLAQSARSYADLTWPLPNYTAQSLSVLNILNQASANLISSRRVPNHVEARYYDHHLTHAAAVCYASPVAEGTCAVIDGYGEQAAAHFYRYCRNGNIELLSDGARPGRKESAGMFYARLCGLCGFDPLKGEEWKVMGLAPYGAYDERLYRLLRPMLAVDGLDLVPGCADRDYAELIRALQADMRAPGAPATEAADLAFTGQLVFCQTMAELLGNVYRAAPSDNLLLGGGCGLNSSWNGLITEQTPFRNLHVFAAPADDGNALGAAWLAYREDHPGWIPPRRAHSPFLGTPVADEVVHNFARFGGLKQVRMVGDDAPQHAARLLAEGKILGWMQGRAEFGPRALGNRSILADPRRPDMKEAINARVKFREEFRPFAPSILEEHANTYFERYQPAPYMERTLRFRPEARDQVPAVVHVDGTGRLQTVTRDHNQRFHALVTEFHRLSGVPVVLNTSLNVMGRPIVHSVEDAIGLFFTTGLDALFLGDLMVEK